MIPRGNAVVSLWDGKEGIYHKWRMTLHSIHRIVKEFMRSGALLVSRWRYAILSPSDPEWTGDACKLSCLGQPRRQTCLDKCCWPILHEIVVCFFRHLQDWLLTVSLTLRYLPHPRYCREYIFHLPWVSSIWDRISWSTRWGYIW